MVLKPSEHTPFATLRVVEPSLYVGTPVALIDVFLGDGPTISTALTGHAGIGKVSFSGSTAPGSVIMANIARPGAGR